MVGLHVPPGLRLDPNGGLQPKGQFRGNGRSTMRFRTKGVEAGVQDPGQLDLRPPSLLNGVPQPFSELCGGDLVPAVAALLHLFFA